MIHTSEREKKTCSVFSDAPSPRAVNDTASLSRGSRANDPSSHQHRSAHTHTGRTEEWYSPWLHHMCF